MIVNEINFKDKSHPINQIRRSDKILDINKTLNSIPIDKLDEIEKLINQQVNNKT